MHLEADGSHKVKLSALKLMGRGPILDADAEFIWHPVSGGHFTAKWRSPDRIFSLETSPSHKTARIGKITSVSMVPDWTARTESGTDVSIIGFRDDDGSPSLTIDDAGTDVHVSGRAVSVEVDIPKDLPLALTLACGAGERALAPYVELGHYFPNTESVHYETSSGTRFAQRRSLSLDADPSITLTYSGIHTGIRRSESSERNLWIVSNTTGKDPADWYSAKGIRGFISFLLGRWLYFAWIDRSKDDQTWRRTYPLVNGSFTRSASAITYPLPLGNTTSAIGLSGRNATVEIGTLYAKWRALQEKFDFGWVLSPLWSAHSGYVEDKLSLACVSLERFRNQVHRLAKADANQGASEPTKLALRWLSKPLKEHFRKFDFTKVRSKLPVDVFEECFNVVRKRVDLLGAPPNALSIETAFGMHSVGLSQDELHTLRYRNSSLHGEKTLASTSTEHKDDENWRYDVLRTLVHRGVLGVLNYNGPYIDYGSRPATGNFEIKVQTSRT